MTRALNRLFRMIEILMAGFLCLMVALFFLNVVLRYFFNSGLIWSEEIARLSFIYLVYLGAIGAFRDNRHLGMQTILERAPGQVQKALYFIVQLIIIWVMVLLVIGSWQMMVQTSADSLITTGYPRALVYAVGAITGIGISLISLGNIVRLLVSKEPVENLLKIPENNSLDAAAKASH